MVVDVDVETQGRGLRLPEQTSLVRQHPPADVAALAGKHVLVVGINYAPEPTGIAPYTTGLAEHLAITAASVTVLTGLPHYPTWQVDAKYRGRLRRTYRAAKDGGPTVIRLAHHVPSRQTALTRGRYEATFLANALTAPIPQRPDLVVAVTPSLGGAVAGARIARRHGVPLLVVVQDLMAKAAGQSGISGGGRVAGITAKLEGYALRSAGQVAVVSEAFRDAVRSYGVPDERISLLPNWTHIAPAGTDQADARQVLGWPADAFIVAHTGNMGLKQDLGNVVDAARRLGSQAQVYLIGDGSQRAVVQAQAAGLANVRFIDPLDDVQYPMALAAADVLLVNERPSLGDMSLPSKLTSYFSAGRPVLAAVSYDGATAAEINRTAGAGLLVPPGQPQKLAAAVLELRDDAVLRAAMGRRGLEHAHRRLGRGRSLSLVDALVKKALTRGCADDLARVVGR